MLRVAGLALACVATTVVGQTPAPAAPSGGWLSGVVRDTDGAPLADVNVTLIGEAAATRSDTAGRFALHNVPVGRHMAIFRRIGYRSVEYRWTALPNSGLVIEVAMTSAPRILDRVVITAPGVSRRSGTSSIGGTVIDSLRAHVAGADVQLLGAGLSTTTDSTGTFEFQMLLAGSYIVRVRKHGLMSNTFALQLLDDDDRGITIKLYGLPKNTKARDVAEASGYGVGEAAFDAFDRRERVTPGRLVLGPGDLFRANHAPLDFLLQQYRDNRFARGGRSQFMGADVGAESRNDGDCILINGRIAEYEPLRAFTSFDVQLVEIFPGHTFVDESVVSQMESLRECRGSMDQHPAYFVLWTRSLR